MTRVRKIGPATETVSRPRKRGTRGARIVRGTDGRPVRARRIDGPVSLRVRLLRVGSVLLLFAFFAALWTRPVREIEVRGLWLASPDFVSAMLAPEVGRRWITTPVKDFEIQLARDPWIDEVQVMRAPGSRLLVRIREVQPLFRVAGLDRCLDRRGRLLPSTGGLLADALPVLEGVTVGDGGVLPASDRARLGALLAGLESSGWLWSSGLARADVSDPDEVVLESRDGVEVVVRLADATETLERAASVWHRVEESGPGRVDLRFADQIVLSH